MRRSRLSNDRRLVIAARHALIRRPELDGQRTGFRGRRLRDRYRVQRPRLDDRRGGRLADLADHGEVRRAGLLHIHQGASSDLDRPVNIDGRVA